MILPHDLEALGPLGVVVGGALGILLLTVARGYRHSPPPFNEALALEGRHVAWLALAALALAVWGLAGGSHEARSAFSGAVILDAISTSFGITALAGAGISIVLSASYLQEHQLAQGEFFALILLASFGMLMVAMAGDLMVLFLGLETMSLAAYILSGYRRASQKSQEAALKYFLYGAFASAFVVFGIAHIYGEVGHVTASAAVDFQSIREAFSHPSSPVRPLGWVGVAMVLSGLVFKIGAVPFHMWAPDVYEGAPTPATAFMAVGIKTAAFAGLCRFVMATLGAAAVASETFVHLIEILAMLSMVGGNFLAIRQTQLKRMLAYSSIAHTGYGLIGVAAFLAKPDSHALEAMAYYLAGYTAMTLGAFGVALALEQGHGKPWEVSLERLAGLGRQHPTLSLAMAVFMLALAGVPPTTGFFGKLSLWTAALSAGRIHLVMVSVVASAVGAFYYLRVLVLMYMRPCASEAGPPMPLTGPTLWLTAGLGLCAMVTVGVGLWPHLYLEWAYHLFNQGLG